MKGILPSLNTPFSKKGDLDLKSLEKLVKHTIRSGCSGMLGLAVAGEHKLLCLLYTSPSPRDLSTSRMPSSA